MEQMDHTYALFVVSIRFHGHGRSRSRRDLSCEINRDQAWSSGTGHGICVYRSASKPRNELHTFTLNDLISAFAFIDHDDPMRSTRVFYLEFPLFFSQLVFFSEEDFPNAEKRGIKVGRAVWNARDASLSSYRSRRERSIADVPASSRAQARVSRRGSRENLLYADRYPRCARFVAIGDSFALLFMERLILCMVFRFVEAFVEYQFGTRCDSSRWRPSIFARPPDAFLSRVFFFHGVGFRFVDYEDICARDILDIFPNFSGIIVPFASLCRLRKSCQEQRGHRWSDDKEISSDTSSGLACVDCACYIVCYRPQSCRRSSRGKAVMRNCSAELRLLPSSLRPRITYHRT